MYYCLTLVMWYVLVWTYSQKSLCVHETNPALAAALLTKDHLWYQPISAWKLSQIKAEDLS